MRLILIILLGGCMAKTETYKTKTVIFESHGQKLVGTLYIPKGELSKHPGVVVTGAWTTVKEQMPRTYAIEMVKRGYVALTFDFRGWGESSGKFRFVEDPKMKTEDIIEAVNQINICDNTNTIGVLKKDTFSKLPYQWPPQQL